LLYTTRTTRTFTHYAQENYTCYAQQKFSHHGKEILHGYVELCTMKKEGVLKPRNRNAFALCKDASFHLTEGLLQKCKTTDTHSTERLTV
jgi:hypothetical protein